MRALIRARHGLPEPPPSQVVDAPTPIGSPASEATEAVLEGAKQSAPKERSTFGLGSARRPASSPRSPDDAPAAPALGVAPALVGVASAPAASPSEASPWTPDALLHRLVELLMQMQALSATPSPCSRLVVSRPDAIQERLAA